MNKVELCLAADETFFDQVILVMLDLPSGYIFVEEKTEKCQHETWQQRVNLALNTLNVKIKYLVSDRAKAIVKLALTDLGTNSISDLFHVLYNLNRSIGWELNCLSSRLQKQLKQAQETQGKSDLIEPRETSIKILQQSRLTYDDSCYRLTKYLHPFELEQTTITPTTQIVSIKLTKILHTLEELRTSHKLKDPRNGIRNLKNQIPYLSSIIDIWWNWAIWMVSKFQRSSSAVEGRNGYLSQVYHNRRGLSIKRLQVSTVIHNFHVLRSDGTTAAQRLFAHQFPDLFEYLVENIGELPQPRKSRKSSTPRPKLFPCLLSLLNLVAGYHINFG